MASTEGENGDEEGTKGRDNRGDVKFAFATFPSDEKMR